MNEVFRPAIVMSSLQVSGSEAGRSGCRHRRRHHHHRYLLVFFLDLVVRGSWSSVPMFAFSHAVHIIPRLEEGNTVVPGAMGLLFDLVVSGHANNYVVRGKILG